MTQIAVSIEGDLRGMLQREVKAGEVAAKRTMALASTTLKTAWRGQIVSAGLGQRLANTIRSDVYPKGRASLNAAAQVWSNASHIVETFDRGAIIRSNNSHWLAIPTEAAGKKGGGARWTPGEWQFTRGIRLRFVMTRNGTAMLVADDARLKKTGVAVKKRGRRRKRDGILSGATTVPIFILVPQVTLRKRLDLDGATQAVASTLPGLILSNWKGASPR